KIYECAKSSLSECLFEGLRFCEIIRPLSHVETTHDVRRVPQAEESNSRLALLQDDSLCSIGGKNHPAIHVECEIPKMSAHAALGISENKARIADGCESEASRIQARADRI